MDFFLRGGRLMLIKIGDYDVGTKVIIKGKIVHPPTHDFGVRSMFVFRRCHMYIDGTGMNGCDFWWNKRIQSQNIGFLC